MKTLSSFLAILLFAALAHSAEIEGIVLDAQTHSPLEGVNILIEGSGHGTSSDEEGRFSLSAPEGTFILSAGFLGYKIEKRRLTPPVTAAIRFELEPVYLKGEEVTVTASRADLGSAPAAFSNLTSSEIRKDYSAQEMPMLLESIPGVFSYSDAGNPQGYSYLKIRGFDQKRVTVLINGIPLNDPEDHQVYWVDMPDLAANVEDIQVQRGLGYSPYGPSAFGGSVNILTTVTPREKQVEISTGYGSFNTRKVSALFNSGLVNNTYQMYGRFSRITSDGYRHNSGFEGWSYFLSTTRFGLKNSFTINLYGGPEFLHAAWDAAPQDSLEVDRKHNPITYQNTVDNFNQPHYELHHTLELSRNLKLSNTLFYIKGRGYWEMYKVERSLFDYGLTEIDTLYSDLVIQKWVDKDQWGWIPKVEYESGDWELIGGGNFNQFQSDHWGKVIWLQSPPPDGSPDQTYYEYNGDIQEASVFAHAAFQANERLKLIADLQFRHLDVEFQQNSAGAFAGEDLNRYQVVHNFLNPKFGASYKLLESTTAYASVGMAQREPSDNEYWDAWEGPDDFGVDPLFATSDTIREGSNAQYVSWSDPLVEPERLIDIELGLRHRWDFFKGALNFYWMDFRNEIIYGGGVSDGYPITGNADKTLHRGVEAEAEWQPLEQLSLYGNLSYSRNTFESDDILGLDPGYNPIPIKGNTVPLFPDLIAYGKVSYRINPGKKFDIEPWLACRYAGEQYLENTNISGAVIDPFFLVNAGFLLDIPAGGGFPAFKVQASVENIFDREYETSGYYDGGNCYYVGTERNYFLGITLGL